jgi:Ca2+-binding EF-hand superfamily protein
MNMKTLAIAALGTVFALTAITPSFAAADPAKKQKHIQHFIKRVDLNGDGKVSMSELEQALSQTFQVVDANHDGALTSDEIAGQKSVLKAYNKQLKADKANASTGERYVKLISLPKAAMKNFAKIDTNGDGVISKAELDAAVARVFQKRDKNHDGYISMADFGG